MKEELTMQYDKNSNKARLGDAWSHECLESLTSNGIAAEHAPDFPFPDYDIKILDECLANWQRPGFKQPTIECKLAGSENNAVKIASGIFEMSSADFVAIKYKGIDGEQKTRVFNRYKLRSYLKNAPRIKESRKTDGTGYDYYSWPPEYLDKFRGAVPWDQFLEAVKTKKINVI